MNHAESMNPKVARIRVNKMLDFHSNSVKAALGKLCDEIERLQNVIRSTHETYCTHDWTSRGLHAPECLLYELVD